MSDFVIASAKDFDSTEVVQLPSLKGTNKAVRLRKPDIISMLAEGDELPDLLTNVALQQANGGVQKEIEVNKDTIPGLMASVNVLCVASFVDPRVGDGENEISLGDIPINDKLFVLNWALGGEFQAAERFPKGQKQGSKPVSEK